MCKYMPTHIWDKNEHEHEHGHDHNDWPRDGYPEPSLSKSPISLNVSCSLAVPKYL